MKRIIILFALVFITIIAVCQSKDISMRGIQVQFNNNNITINPVVPPPLVSNQIIADHTIVQEFDDIPQYYLDKVKEMSLHILGESHARGYSQGLELLELAYPTYPVNVTGQFTDGEAPETYTNAYLRLAHCAWGNYSYSTGWRYAYGEGDWFTNGTAISRTKAGISYCNTNGNDIDVMGFGWCGDMTYPYKVSPGVDPVYGCHWYGESYRGPQGNIAWGLDASDYSITGNTVCMDSYLKATQEYIDYCTIQGYDTKVFFSTGPVDPAVSWTGEIGYQGHIKNEYIRDYVLANPSRILFDYADILCYDDDGRQTTQTWNGHTYPSITTANLGDNSIGHIGSAGALRLAKAMWWMMARIAGWDGN